MTTPEVRLTDLSKRGLTSAENTNHAPPLWNSFLKGNAGFPCNSNCSECSQRCSKREQEDDSAESWYSNNDKNYELKEVIVEDLPLIFVMFQLPSDLLDQLWSFLISHQIVFSLMRYTIAYGRRSSSLSSHFKINSVL